MNTSPYTVKDTLSIWALAQPIVLGLLAIIGIILIALAPALAIVWALDEEEDQYLKGEKPEWALTMPSVKGSSK